MEKKITNMRAIVEKFAEAMNLLSAGKPMHHQQVAYLAYQIGDAMGYSGDEKSELIYGALLYDIGSVFLPEKEGTEYSFYELSKAGVGLVGDVQKLSYIRDIFNACRESYAGVALNELPKYAVFSQIINLAAKVSAMLNPADAALNQVQDICDTVSELSNGELSEGVVESFLKMSEKEYIWFEALHQPDVFLSYISDSNDVTLDDVIVLSKFMSRIIDFRSQYTAMHSCGVAATAVRLAEIMGMSEDECKMMMIAGYLHDVGKLKVPKAILEKSDKLTDEEFNVVKEYAYYTYLLLSGIPGFELISSWASLHHEKLNGYGYPFGLAADDIPMGARIIAVADIFSAVAEIRSYRQGMSREEVIQTLADYVETGALSRYIAGLLIQNYDDIYSIRDEEVRKEGARYFASVVDSDGEE
ncbi:MAG: HD domain-containing protein [Eubacterium sp.]|nr:HD domain-containing protein [Eubacterium sp.]